MLYGLARDRFATAPALNAAGDAQARARRERSAARRAHGRPRRP
jgi:hypothetical protein